MQNSHLCLWEHILASPLNLLSPIPSVITCQVKHESNIIVYCKNMLFLYTLIHKLSIFFFFFMVNECPSDWVLRKSLHKEKKTVKELCVTKVMVWWMMATQSFVALPRPVSGSVLWLPWFTWSLKFTNLV